MEMQCIIGILLLACAVCAFVVVMDSNRFVVREYALESDKIEKDIQFVFLSDLHNKCYGKHNQRLFHAIEECRPDFILCGGDMVTANPGAKPDVAIRFMQSLAPKYRIYYANGNHEQRLRLYPEKYGDMHEIYDAALKKCGIERLLNQTDYWGKNIAIHGLELDRKYYKRFRKNVPEAEEIKKLFLPAKCENRDYHILLAHNPEYFDVYARTGVDLVLSGHVHGGVARIPIAGGMISPSFQIFPKYDGGIFEKDGCTMILSRGLGTHTIPIRFLNPAELVFVTIRAGKRKNQSRTIQTYIR